MDASELYKTSPPELGRSARKYFGFDPQYTNLNNGSYGSPPLPVLAACNSLSNEAESNPDLFIRLTCRPLLKRVRQQVADLVGAHVDECVMVTNASLGLNTILWNFEWERQDIIIAFNTTYSSISKTIQYLSDRPPHPSIVEFTVLFPTTHADIIARFRDFVRQLPRPAEGEPKRKVVAVIDSIISNPGVLLPWKELVTVCREEGVWSVIDAAHSIGQEQDLDLSSAKPDFWVSNCHKWLFAKRGCAVLYVPFRNQHIIKTSIPTSYLYTSPASGKPPVFGEQFERNGAIDYVPFLSVSHALEFRAWLGGEQRINEYCHKVALEGGRRLAEILGTTVLDPDGSLTLNMVDVELPLSTEIQPSWELVAVLQQKLIQEHKIYAGHHFHNGKWWTRCSTQVYNDLNDFETLGKVWPIVCKEVELEFEHKARAEH
ncbi:hypothetical protein HGRIS_000934 [Hohenbuehelia grisea]|uniref:Aminotransferase class V domain-containing protein n=1 Tax=Hohenbuehelia grisea TaxID=104357 RepID=A0ABR3IQ69_9AGAR